MKRWAAILVAFPKTVVTAVAVLLAVGGLLVAASGVIPIKASSGHWAITEWFLQFSKRRSVQTHSLFVGAPPERLDDRSYVLRGAGHYETGCRPCHGAPGDPIPRIPQAMTPIPPRLSDRVPLWDSRELFYIVKHGIKFTGMPAWPALGRDDEIWSMVAFLRRLPAMDGAEYERLARGGDTSLTEMFAGTTPVSAPPDIIVEVCARCHGLDGRGRGAGAFPKLAGQRSEYMRRAMHAYAEGRRHSGIMEPIASGLPEDARHAAIRYYASLPAPSASTEAGADLPGFSIASRGIPEDDIPSCHDCHGPGAAPVNDAYPRLAGQYADYIRQQLRVLRQRARGGSEYVHIMHNFVDRLSDEQIDQVAEYYAALGGSGR